MFYPYNTPIAKFYVCNFFVFHVLPTSGYARPCAGLNKVYSYPERLLPRTWDRSEVSSEVSRVGVRHTCKKIQTDRTLHFRYRYEMSNCLFEAAFEQILETCHCAPGFHNEGGGSAMEVRMPYFHVSFEFWLRIILALIAYAVILFLRTYKWKSVSLNIKIRVLPCVNLVP